jgi:cardiolipin synthase
MTIANLITLFRMVLVPVFGVLWWHHEYLPALIVFIAAGISDVLDGFLARFLDQRSRLGQLLDPAADKLMMFVSFVVAALQGIVPYWLAALVIGRDVLLAAGSALVTVLLPGRFGPDRWHPTRLGKYATFAQLGTITMALTLEATGYAPLKDYLGTFVVTSAALTVLSGTQYVLRPMVAGAFGSERNPEGVVP